MTSDHLFGMDAYLGERIAAQAAFELMAPVTLSAVCFRLRDGDDAANQRLLSALTAEGSALLGPVFVNGHAGLRACVTNYRTTKEDLDLVMEWLAALAAA
jgi:aromatic-L-amino-acid/L-tryptophan decarboxylase